MLIDPNVSKIQPFENVKIYKEMNGHPVACENSRPSSAAPGPSGVSGREEGRLFSQARPSERCPTQRPDAIHFFVNFDFFKSLYLSQN